MGIELTEQDLLDLGEASYNLEKAFNTLHTDFTRKDDYPPRRYMDEPIKSGPLAGRKIEKQEYDRMLDQFYELLGWDKVTGLQTDQCLSRLGLGDVAGKLQVAGKLINS